MQRTPLPLAFLLVVLAQPASASLLAYDAAIAGSGFTARTTTIHSFTGSNQVPFNFGAISGDATFEFILAGDPVAGGAAGHIAQADANPLSTLRYEQWNDTGQMGFTQGGVLDYLFTPAVLPPTVDTHVAYRWLDGPNTMELYLNGALAGTTTGVNNAFQMPTGSGRIGNHSTNGSGMVGTISRVTTFNSALESSAISSHANAWLSTVPEASESVLFCLGGLALALGRRRRFGRAR